jgi:hypothetical protein
MFVLCVGIDWLGPLGPHFGWDRWDRWDPNRWVASLGQSLVPVDWLRVRVQRGKCGQRDAKMAFIHDFWQKFA